MRSFVDMRLRKNIKSDMLCPIPGGFLVAIEGIDGSGKTTQAELLAKFCSENRLSHVVSKEPTKGQYGQMIRDSALRGRMSAEQEIDLLRKDRREHVKNVIRPALEQEEIVILDRYYFSTAAYQGAHGADAEAILADNESFAPQPDLLIVLDVPPETGLQRIQERGDAPNQFESVESLKHAQDIFNHIQRPYKVPIDARSGIPWVWFWVSKHFQMRALNKISQPLNKVPPSDLTFEDALNRTREFFGEDRLPMAAMA